MEKEERITWKNVLGWILVYIVVIGMMVYSRVRAYNDGFERGATVALDTVQKIMHTQAHVLGDSTCTKIVFRDTVTYILSNKTLKR